ncbi:cytochrome-c oxidase, cbb3-type subunit III [Rhodothalassium salexigens]|uniref:cytochrome-c oxidase, cbb3-type subunit III n=1 Tax=Rhodothalassium salexigens TaxID=1086 RepID=UPI0019149325|nr:cytochrome-c oxidase, cbb3-type subunit III [Rhodothalassium salexigens]MBK5912001.1 cytochrome-c oxidase, cbb3-type subunit III [Rhodothalassium salexigens]
MSTRETDEPTGKETTGHEWDGIKELDTPLPAWWLYTFYACIALSMVFFVLWPSWPIPTADGWTYTKGIVGYSQRQRVEQLTAEARADLEQEMEAMRDLSLAEIRTDKALMPIALKAGEAAFGDNCAGCHGSGAQGFEGFPNLNDDAWIWGGSLEAIHQTIENGIRWDDNPDTRYNVMPSFLSDGILTREQVGQVVQYVRRISDQEHDAAKAEQGAAIYDQQCGFCHGAQGKGMADLGAPNLSDAIWLYGGDVASLTETVSYSRYGVMPAWEDRLDPLTIKQLAVYVHALGGGEPVATADAGSATAPAMDDGGSASGETRGGL